MKLKKNVLKQLPLPLLLLLTFLLALFTMPGCSSNKLLYPVEVKSLYGYINYRGSLQIPPKYPKAQRYSEGFAPVQRNDGSLIYLDLDGNELEIPTAYGSPEKLDIFSDGMARVVVGQQVGFLDKKLLWAIPPRFTQAGRFAEGLAAVFDVSRKRGAYIDKKGSEVFALDNVAALGPMKAGFAYFVREGRFGIVDKQGQIVRKAQYLFMASADPATGLARAQDEQTELLGFVDRSGTWIISPRYPNAGDFSDGLAAVYVRAKNRYGYIDARGNLQIPAQYLQAGGFHEGFAWVRTDKGFRYIDRDGRWLSPLVFTYTHNFYAGLAAAAQGNSQLYIDTEGGVIWPSQ
ncbi:MAG: WG repeat-containing protein [Spirochaetota bacterium]